jgi:subfamily B ATP-binding cassette protein MsbA
LTLSGDAGKPSNFRTFGQILRPHAGPLAGSFIFSILGTLFDLLQPMPLKVVLDNVFRSRAPQDWLSRLTVSALGADRYLIVLYAAIAVVVIAVMGAACSYFEKFFMTTASQWVTHDLRAAVYSRIQGLGLSFHDNARTGDLMTRVTSDIDSIQSFITSGLLDALLDVLLIAGMLAVMFSFNWRFTLVALSVTPVMVFIAARYTRRIRQSAREVRKKQGEIASRIQETFASIRVVKAFAREEFEEQKLEAEALASIELAMRARQIKSRLTPVIDVIVACGQGIVLLYGARLVLKEEIAPSLLIVFLSYLNKMYKPMQDLSKMSDQYSKAAVGYERIREVLETDSTVRDSPGATTAPEFRGEIEFDRVTLRYNGGPPALRGVNCRIHTGQVTAIVGPTGAGKTSLISLVPRFYDPVDGAVRIDGHDVREYTQKSLRDQISLVSQESILFHASIRENIAYGLPDAGFEQILHAASVANAHEFIERLPEGYETVVGERGITLSGGQRQRIAIARAVIRNTPILILDEPGSGLDSASEKLVFEALDRLMTGKTSIVIAHRLSTVRRADVILVMRDGEIVESGSHADLLSAGGLYHELYRIQFAGRND